jgi:phosphoenolpyruvate---glycerone phosphotransferase subunit DhaL
MKEIRQSDVEMAVKSMAQIAIENENYFSDLDAVAGDADFGVSLATGFRAVLEQWDDIDRTSISSFLLKVSMIISKTVGGCSGPIWGTAFMRSGIKAKDKETLAISDLVEMFRSAIEGIQARGGAELGDKTLLDALAPATACLEEHAQTGQLDVLAALVDAANKANDAIEGTRDWLAKRGRQYFVGERTKGTLDPGIVAVATMFGRIIEYAKNANKE